MRSYDGYRYCKDKCPRSSIRVSESGAMSVVNDYHHGSLLKAEGLHERSTVEILPISHNTLAIWLSYVSRYLRYNSVLQMFIWINVISITTVDINVAHQISVSSIYDRARCLVTVEPTLAKANWDDYNEMKIWHTCSSGPHFISIPPWMHIWSL